MPCSSQRREGGAARPTTLWENILKIAQLIAVVLKGLGGFIALWWSGKQGVRRTTLLSATLVSVWFTAGAFAVHLIRFITVSAVITPATLAITAAAATAAAFGMTIAMVGVYFVAMFVTETATDASRAREAATEQHWQKVLAGQREAEQAGGVLRTNTRPTFNRRPG